MFVKFYCKRPSIHNHKSSFPLSRSKIKHWRHVTRPAATKFPDIPLSNQTKQREKSNKGFIISLIIYSMNYLDFKRQPDTFSRWKSRTRPRCMDLELARACKHVLHRSSVCSSTWTRVTIGKRTCTLSITMDCNFRWNNASINRTRSTF